MFQTKEQLMAMGLTAEQADSVIKAHNDTIADQYIPMHRFNEVYEENKKNKETITTLNQQITQLSEFQGTNEELTQRINTLTTQNTEMQQKHQQEIDQLKHENAIRLGVTNYKCKPHDVDLVMGKIDREKLTFNDKGEVSGLSEQLDALSKDSSFLFQTTVQTPNKPAWFPKGTEPESGKNPQETLSAAAQLGAALAKGRSSVSAGTQSGMDYFFGSKNK